MTAAITTADLTKFYGKHRGVVNLNLEIRDGEAFGLLGPNGAGKTTCIRLFLDFIHPTTGSATIFGLDSHTDSVQVKNLTGYLPGEFLTYEHLTVLDLLIYFANMRDGKLGRAYELASRFDLDLTRKIGELSRGNRQKVGLVQAFMSNPRLLILDEPSTGLDPLLQQEFHKLVTEEIDAGKTVFVSSHVLSEVEVICDRVGIIRDGTIITVEEVATLRERALTRVEIEFGEPVSHADFENISGTTNIEINDYRLTCNVTGSIDPLIKKAALKTVIRIQSGQPGLEELFLAYYSENEATGDSDAP